MPANARIDQCDTLSFECFRQGNYLFHSRSIFHQIQHRKTEHNNEVRAYRFADCTNHFKRKAHAVFIRATKLIGTLIGTRIQHLSDEVTF